MKQGFRLFKTFAVTAAVGGALALNSVPARAADDPDRDALMKRIEQMETEIGDLRTRLEQTDKRSEQPASEAPEQTVAQAAPYPGVAPRTFLPGLADTSFHIAGYADTSLIVSDGNSGSTFAATFNPALYIRHGNLVLFESELEIAVDQEGKTEVELEFAQIDLLLHDNATLVAGKFLSPVGQFQERLHPSWINRLADAPAGFGHGGVQPTAEVGVQLRGGVPLGRGRFTYALALGNGPRLDGAGEVMTEGFGGDDNANKAISGRIGFLPLPYFEVGASFLRAKLNGPSGAPVIDTHGTAAPLSIGGAAAAEPGDLSAFSADYNLWGLDAAYTRGPWTARFEYLRGVRDAISAPDHDGMLEVALPRLRMKAWYGQLSYRLSGVTDDPILGNFEPVVRYGEYSVVGLDALAEEAAEKRWDWGLNYWLAPSVVFHSVVQRRNFTARHPGENDADTRLLFKLAYGF